MSMNFLVENQPYMILLPIGLILLLSKIFSLLGEKLKLPQVIGFLVAGLIVGTIYLIPNQNILNSFTVTGINDLAKIGVILIMFEAGVETDLKKIKAVGKASIIITIFGVLVPLGLGALVAFLFLPKENVYTNIYYGIILSATSVSITIATLKEIGVLDSKVGTAITSAAIIDDLIGVILLSLVISLSGNKENAQYSSNTTLNVLIIIGVMIIFFIISIGLSFIIRKLFNWMGKKWPHHVRIPIFSLAICFIMAYLAERFFNIADITGAYIAGLIFSLVDYDTKKYIDHRAETTSHVFFSPIFFASIALMLFTSNINFSDKTFIIFGILWVVAGILSKIIGAGLGGLISKFNLKDSTKIGIGMMARAEVLIVCAHKGIDANLISMQIMPFTLSLIIITSFITPILLKILYRNEKPENLLTNNA